MLFLCCAFEAKSQSADSLRILVNKQTSDTAKFRFCNSASVLLANTDVKSAIGFASEAKAIAEKRKDLRGQAEALNNLSFALYYSGESDTAITLFTEAIRIARAAGDSDNVVFALNRIGYIYREKGQYLKATSYYNAALASNKGEKNVAEAANSYLNIGVLYHDQSNYKDALRYEEKGLALYRESGDQGRIANSLARLGNVYLDLEDSSKALQYYEEARTIFAAINHQRGIAVCLNNIAMIYGGRHQVSKSIDYYTQALKIREAIGDRNGVALVCNNLGSTYLELKQYEKAIYFLNKSLVISRELGYRDMMRSDYNWLSKTYEALGDYQKSLSFYKQFHLLSDSLFNDRNSKEMNELSKKFDTERREKDYASLLRESELRDEALAQERTRNLVMISALLLLIVLVFVIWRNASKRKRANILLERQKSEIATQKKIVEEQHRDILDSINYAQRIQDAMLPSKEDMKALFPQSFVFFRPRDIVSGDFWWIGQSGKIKVIAAVDCTGHGVPGAFMSLIGNTVLNEVIKGKGVSDPGAILAGLAVGVVAALKQNNSVTDQTGFTYLKGIKDGMDVSICCIDEEKGLLHYAGANNPVYFIRDGKMNEIKGDRQPVGVFEGELKPFSVHTLPLNEIESFYLFTDGYADQFGGPNGKKFKYSRLKELLFTNHQLPVNEQQEKLSSTFDKWKGGLDQVDDVLVVGVRLK